MYLDVSLGVSACGGSDKCDYNYVASCTGHEVQSSAAWDLKNVADDGIAYQPCPFRDFQQFIFAPWVERADIAEELQMDRAEEFQGVQIWNMDRARLVM